MSSPAPSILPVPKAPFLAASAIFVAVAVLIGLFAIAPLGAAELLGIAACVAAAAVFASAPFVVDFTRRLDTSRAPAAISAAPAPTIDPAQLAEQITAAVESRLAASEDRRRDELLRAATAAAANAASASGAGSRPPLDTDQIAAPAAGARPRLGRGLASLIHSPSALARPAAETDKPPAPDDADNHRAAA